MKPILQSEATECGLACLAMIASHHGHKVDLNGMRQRFGLSMKGAGLRDLMGFADKLGFGARALRAEPESLKEIALPALLHWDLNHFVVLQGFRKNRFVVLDPARGKVELTPEEFSNHFTGVAVEFTPVASFKPIELQRKTRLSSLWSQLSGLKRSAVQIVILSIVVQLFVLVSPFYLQLVIDNAVVSFDKDLLLLLALGFGFLYIINAISTALRSWVILLLGQSMTFQMAGNIIRHLFRLPMEYFEKRHVGDIVSRIGSIQPIQKALTESVVAAIIDGVMAIATVVLMFIYDWRLAVVAIALTFAYLVISLILFPFMRDRQESLIANSAREQTYVIESIRASRAVKLFGRESERENSWRNHYAEVVNAGISFGKFGIANQFSSNLFFGLQTVLIVYFGTLFIFDGDMTVGMLFAFMSYRQSFATAVEGIIEKGIEFRMLNLHLDRLSDIVQADKEEGLEVLDSGRTLEGKVELADLGFRYASSDPVVFEGINLSVAPGEFVAIAGPSGGGKTTLLKVMLGLLRPTEGATKIDGLPLDTFGLRNWRAETGVVMQDDQLLTGTIADNISFFDPNIDMQRVVECAAVAQVHDDISNMPMQYLSMIGDMGAALSGGQRQRLLLARALYHKPKILFLDEGTANLDMEAEKRIADVLSGMDITRIVVAHREELLERADRVFDMIDGNLVQRMRNLQPVSYAPEEAVASR